MTTYTTSGDVRGECGHQHRTLSGAVRCLESDQRGCESQGGYSDRHIIDSDGDTYDRYDDGDYRIVEGYGSSDPEDA